MNTTLTIEECIAIAPSIGAERPMENVSEKYSFLPTRKTLEVLSGHGWNPVRVQQQRVKNPNSPRQGFQKHVIHLQHKDLSVPKAIGEDRVELILENSHDRTTRESLRAGIFRLVCLNGMVVAKEQFDHLRITHIYQDRDAVNSYMGNIATRITTVSKSIEEWKQHELLQPDRVSFAERALELRFGENRGTWPIGPETLLEPRRKEDQDRSLWTTLNVIQENIMRGGQYETRRTDANGRWFSPTKPITSLDRGLTLNESLWELATLYSNN